MSGLPPVGEGADDQLRRGLETLYLGVMDRTIIHVMRHGEVDNPNGVLYGRLPGFGLTELGHQMAARAADYLQESGADIARVISSPLLRAQLTAAPTAAAYGLSLSLIHI